MSGLRSAASDEKGHPRGGTVTSLPARAASAGGGDLLAEVRRLRAERERRERTIDCLVEATETLRRGSLALREENRELRLQIQRLQRDR